VPNTPESIAARLLIYLPLISFYRKEHLGTGHIPERLVLRKVTKDMHFR
jgi:hypothetical protein